MFPITIPTLVTEEVYQRFAWSVFLRGKRFLLNMFILIGILSLYLIFLPDNLKRFSFFIVLFTSLIIFPIMYFGTDFQIRKAYRKTPFWKDMEQTDLVQAYRAAGFHLVTSGYKLDRYFLSRQRFLIQLADATASNSVGTHIGYCVHLDRPHTLVDTEYRVEAAGLLSQHWAHLDDTDRSRAIWLEETEEVASHFRHASGSISAAQRAVVDKYWGTSYVRTQDEMRDFILSTRHL